MQKLKINKFTHILLNKIIFEKRTTVINLINNKNIDANDIFIYKINSYGIKLPFMNNL